MFQTSIDDILRRMRQIDSDLTSEEIRNAINDLENKDRMLRREIEVLEKKHKKIKEKLEAREKKRQEDERIQTATCMELPTDWENLFDSDARTQGVHVDRISDALIMSLTTLGKVDIEYISSITGQDYKTVICSLKGSIFQNPDTWEECFYKGWETAEEYLSGNLMRKWKTAAQANKTYRGYFQDNVTALEAVLPPTVATEDIYVTLGSPWVPTDIIDDFICFLQGRDLRPYYTTKHDVATGTWKVPCKGIYYQNVRTNDIFGTKRINAMNILEKTLNMKSVAVMDEVADPQSKSGKKKILNQGETVIALDKQKKMIEGFQNWVWKDPERKKRLEEIFENNYSCVRRRMFDGSFLEFPNMSSAIQLYPYQKNAVARILFTPNTLLAHDVGAGKTYVMIAAGMELIRMGLSEKNMYVVPNNLIGQWNEIFHTMYPNANVLCVDSKSFTPTKREKTLKRMRDEKFDGILISYSCFERIPTSTTDDTDNEITFEDLKVNRLFVDEAHNFKNVPLNTKADHVLGISSSGSKKCKDMMDKVHMVQKMNDGKGVVLATGTPITNSITDVYIMQKYLQSGELSLLNLQSFDSWIGMFAEKRTEFEIDVDTSKYRLATRFSKFHNLPELTALLSSIADFHSVDSSAGIPETDGYHDNLIAKTDEFSQYLKSISLRADLVRSKCVHRTVDNMLKITTDGRKAALDLRLVDPSSGFTLQSKVVRCAENVADIYYKTTDLKSAQLVFCDSSTPKSGFNMYDELRRLLTLAGIPDHQIAYIHDADTETRRAKLFAKVQDGEIRILIGSTFKLGLGVNIQNRLIALHHLDVPWRPADLIQREGRILRRGNENDKVQIFRYITEGSFDAYTWQLLETKASFIAALLSGTMTARSGSDIENTVLNYAEVKALAVGNPLIKERVETANELTRLKALQHKLIEVRLRLENELRELPSQKQHQQELIQNCKSDLADYIRIKKRQPIPLTKAEKEQFSEERKALRTKLAVALQKHIMTGKEKILCEYNGFSIILPPNLTLEKPFIRLQRNGRYYVELGNTDVGNLIRIDNFLDNLPEYLENLNLALFKIEERENQIRSELQKDESCAEQISICQTKLETLDKKLGVA